MVGAGSTQRTLKRGAAVASLQTIVALGNQGSGSPDCPPLPEKPEIYMSLCVCFNFKCLSFQNINNSKILKLHMSLLWALKENVSELDWPSGPQCSLPLD